MDAYLANYDMVVIALLTIFTFNVVLNALAFTNVRRPGSRRSRDWDEPKVSVLIPARNEAHQIGLCLESLSRQTYRNLEVIVLDDCSEDATLDVIREAGFSDRPKSKLRYLTGQALPKGWAGKPWACYQLSRQATGDYLLFTDADTVHHSQSVESAMKMAMERDTDLLSVWPHQITETWSEKLVIPMIYLLGQMWIPFWFLRLVQKSPGLKRCVPKFLWKDFGVANGQYMLFKRSAYKEIGSHQVVKDHLVEDVALGREVAKRIPKGWRLLNADGHAIVECRMYRDFLGVWEGFSKNLRPVFEKRGYAFFGVGLVMVVTMLLPFVWFVLREQPWLVTIQAQLILLIRLILTIRFRTDWLSLALHPFAMLLSLLIGMNSWRQSKTGTISWKRRQYDFSTGESPKQSENVG